MRATGIIRRMDDLGRIYIPKEVRRQLFGKEDMQSEPFEIFTTRDGEIVLKKYNEREINIGDTVKIKAEVVDYNKKDKKAKLKICGYCDNNVDEKEVYIRIGFKDIERSI